MTLTDLEELGRRKRVHRLEGNEPAAESLQGGDGARLFLLIGLIVESDARGVRQRFVLG